MKYPALALIFALGLPHLLAADPSPQIVPAVRSWTPSAGVLDASGAFIEVTPADAAALEATATVIREDFAPLKSGLGKPVPTRILLALDSADASKPEGYTLEIAEQITIRGTSPAAVYYGSRSLLQLLRQSSTLPKGMIRDWPSYKGRMLMLDVGRKPYPIAALKDFIRMMGWYKMNELHLHLSDEAFGGSYAAFRIQSATFPGLAAKDLSYTKADLRDLQDFAKARGITITPEIDMPGHARCFTNYWPDIALKGYPNYMDVTNPKTIELMKKLLDEMIPLFDAPDFHIGTDEYRVDGPRRAELHEAFRQFINTMNAHIRSHGKNCRIWSGFEHMGGTTQIDPTVTIDMWETDDAKSQIAIGHAIINSNHGRTYIVPGCHYYGISRSGIYQEWEPWMVSGDMAKNPAKDDPKLLGGKLHVWADQGPTGYTLTEIADTTLTGIQPFAEKLWGTKGSPDYKDFTARCAKTMPIPNVTLLDRLPARTSNIMLDLPGEVTLKDESSSIPLPLAKAGRADLEYPWTLTMEIKRSADTKGRGVILSSELAEICANYSQDGEKTTTDANGKTSKQKISLQGLGTIRAAGARTGDNTPTGTHVYRDVSKASDKQLPLNQWATLTVVGEQGRNTIWLNGEKILESPNQLICPLRFLGSTTSQSFVGSIRNLHVFSVAFTPKQVGRAAGLDIPDNLAAGAKATASASDSAHGLDPENAVDENPSTRWSSGITNKDQWLAIDLGSQQTFSTVTVLWETAAPKTYRIQVSNDSTDWQDVFTGEANPGPTTASFPIQHARHVRLLMSQPRTGWGYSIYEIEILARRATPGK